MKTTMLSSLKASVIEMLTFSAVCISVTVWVTSTYVEKSAAKEFSDSVDRRFDMNERRSQRIDEKLNKIENDVTRIRTILEHRQRIGE